MQVIYSYVECSPILWMKCYLRLDLRLDCVSTAREGTPDALSSWSICSEKDRWHRSHDIIGSQGCSHLSARQEARLS